MIRRILGWAYPEDGGDHPGKDTSEDGRRILGIADPRDGRRILGMAHPEDGLGRNSYSAPSERPKRVLFESQAPTRFPTASVLLVGTRAKF